MSINPRYFDYLDHLGRTVPVSEMHRRPERSGVALRHDVDDDLDLALEMAYWERERGCLSSYYLLHTAPYWEAGMLEAALQIQDFGHEVGLHVNALGAWAAGATDDVVGTVGAALSELRGAGLDVKGVSAHGDPICYTAGFSNYWAFRELRPSDPSATESGLSAEGIPVEDPAFQLRYPDAGAVRRPDGSTFELWSISMADLGLTYDAVHVAHDAYFTDTGGDWIRSADPLTADLSVGRHQVLVHPQYWRGAPQRFFFLSTARAGSKWLARVIDASTPLRCRHEFTLNHRYENGACTPDKRTAHGFVDLLENRSEAVSLMKEARSCIEDVEGDYAEANIYLVHLLTELFEVFPDARFVHLHRDPRAVVRSILHRGWYDTPLDDRHAPVDVEGWESLSAFEKACWYVRDVATKLLDAGLPRLALEEIASSPDRLEREMRALGIAFYPRLAASVLDEVVDATSAPDVPHYEAWTLTEKIRFHRICGETMGRLGYSSRVVEYLWRILRPAPAVSSKGTVPTVTLYEGRTEGDRISTHACRTEVREDGIHVFPDGGRHAHVVLGGAEWATASEGTGWATAVAAYVRGRLEVSLRGGSGTLFALTYGPDGGQMEKRPLARLTPERDSYTFSFRAKPHAARFDVAVYLPVPDQSQEAVIGDLLLERAPATG